MDPYIQGCPLNYNVDVRKTMFFNSELYVSRNIVYEQNLWYIFDMYHIL